jgi:hypothetical protein
LHSARSTTFWVLLSLGAAFAVLAWSAERGQQAPQLSARGAAPVVRAVDRPPPAAVMQLLDLELGIAHAGTISSILCAPGPCKAADIADARAREAARLDAIRPAAGTGPRAVAELPGKGTLLAWRNRTAQVCLVAVKRQKATPVFGPCLPGEASEPCTAICLVSSGLQGGSGAPTGYLLAGTVSSAATALQVTTARGRTVYPLQGPILRGTGRRVFMLDLGHDDFRVLELLQGTKVIDSRELPAVQAAFEDCQAAHPAMSDFKSCIQAAGAIVRPGSFP